MQVFLRVCNMEWKLFILDVKICVIGFVLMESFVSNLKICVQYLIMIGVFNCDVNIF